MDVAPGHLARAFTTPSPSHSRLPNSSSSTATTQGHPHTLSQYSNFSQPSRSSDSTQDTAASILFAGTSLAYPPTNGLVGASNNVINRVAEKEVSLFQICVTLRNKLKGLPEIEDQILETEELAREEEDPVDPVTILWRTFRRGHPLLTIYNALQPEVPLRVTEIRQDRREKTAAFKFIDACIKELKFATADVFMIADLYGEDTAGFVKVVRVVNRVVDKLIQDGLLAAYEEESDDLGNGGPHDSVMQPQAKRTQRQHIVDELVRTERTYVNHLELLQSFKKLVEQKGVIAGDAVHDIFLNLDALLDFQRRFLIRVEQTNALPEEKQNWGQLIKMYAEAFKVYEPYITNQKRCEEVAMRDFDKLREAGGSDDSRQIVESPTVLTSFLLKPFQRLSKYPLLLKELRDKGDLDSDRRDDIFQAIEAITAILERINAYIDFEERQKAVQALKSQVEDWRHHRVEAFGQLLVHGAYTVIKSDGTNSEREYNMYLFEKILLCCKELGPKQMAKMKYRTVQPPDKKGRPRMAMKGRIFMQNVTDVFYFSKVGSYTLQIYWRGDEAIENFLIRYPSEEVGKKWYAQIDIQRKLCQEQARRTTGESLSDSEFAYIRDQGVLENPYRNDDNDDNSEYQGHALSRNASSTSLRSRSTTGDSSSQSTVRGAQSKYPMVTAGVALSLRTRELPNAVASPSERNGGSYFSPTIDSPLSTRTSSSSGVLSFPRQATPLNGWHGEDSNRYTAPAYMRPVAENSVDDYHQADPRNGRIHASPALPLHPASLAQTRNRSASSPVLDLANRRAGASPPPIPNMPSQLGRNSPAVNRSQNGSPNCINGIVSMDGQISQYMPHTQPDYDSMRTMSPAPLNSKRAPVSELTTPTQLRVRVKVPSEGSAFVLVVAYNISCQALKDRIDSKLQRHSSISLATGTVKLKYLYDDVFITIQTDEDVQTAFETWKDHEREPAVPGQQGEVELFCHR